MKPRIGIIPGDPGGIGPELIAKLLADPEVRERADILLIGDRHLFEMGQAQAGTEIEMVACDAYKGDWTDIGGLAIVLALDHGGRRAAQCDILRHML